MLDSVDLKVRLSKATELVDRHLQVISSSSDKHLMLLHEVFLLSLQPSKSHVLMFICDSQYVWQRRSRKRLKDNCQNHRKSSFCVSRLAFLLR
jgi:hypothetical protein